MSPIVRCNVGLSLFSLALVLGAVAPSAQLQPPSQVSPAVIPSRVEPGEALAIRGTSAKTGLVTFAAATGRGILLPGMTGTTAVDRALTFVDFYGRAFGIDGRLNVLPLRASAPDALGQEHVRLRQVYQGIPVTAGELIVHLRGDRVSATNGHALADFPAVMTPAVAPGAAQDQAQALVQKNRPEQAGGARYSEPLLEVFNRGMIDEGTYPSRLAWFVEASGEALREFIWVDAQTGGILLSFSQLAEAKNRSVHNLNHGTTLPGPVARTEGQPANADTDVNQAYDYSGLTYDYYSANHGRDSFDGAGGLMRSSVRYGVNYQNAGWTGTQMVYGDGFTSADDVVAHELTHAVTEFSANLLYYNQSGALNESYSDVFGETIDLTNGVGNDTAGVRWKIAEDLSIGAIRDMMTPTLYGDPGKMSDSAQFFCASNAWTAGNVGDQGGVHINSGIPNHAYALMVDGGTYNGRTIAGIGTTKAAKIQYRALTTYLTSGSGFLDNATALNQSCTDLIGTAGITTADCSQVANAILAVEMANTWACTGATPPPATFCPAGGSPVAVFADGFETGFGKWTATSTTTTQWVSVNDFASKGRFSAYGDDGIAVSDHRLAMTNPVTVPSVGRLSFDQAFEFEHNTISQTSYDGGVLEYSTNGTTWIDAGSLIDAGQAYNGTIAAGNPLSTRTGFVRSSFGYTATRLNLASLAGQSVRFRFRVGTDSSIGSLGWVVDNVQLYACSAAQVPTAVDDSYATPFNTQLNVPAPGVLGNDNANGGGTMTAVLDTTVSAGTGTLSLSTNGGFTYTPASGFSGPATFTYHAINTNGPSTIATVTVNVGTGQGQPGFSLQPFDSTVLVGQSAQFSVAVTGSPTPTCQWQSSANLGASWTNLSNSPPYSGVTTTQLAVSNATLAMSATQFRCFASNTQGTSASNGATLSVAVVGSGGTPSSGGWTGSTSQSLSYGFTVNGGTNITPVAFSVSVPGCGFTVSMTLGRTIPIVNNAFSYTDTPGSCTTVDSMTGTFASPTNASGILRLTHTQAVGCNCVGTTQVSWNATSPAALPQFLLHPANQTRATGQNAQFTVAASGSPVPTFQWEMSTNGGGSWGNVPTISPYSGGATPTLTILGSGLSGLNGAQFRARAQNASGPATSNAATLTVITGPVPPTSVDDFHPTPFNTPLNVAAPGVLGNDNPNTGGAMTAAVVAGPLKGQLMLATNGGFTYTPNANTEGIDSFTYKASNAGGAGNVATVVILVGPPIISPAPTNFRVVSMAGNTVTFAWTPPTSGAPPTGYQIEGGLVPGQVLGSLPLGVTPVTTLTLPSGALFLRMRTLSVEGVSVVASNELLTYVNVAKEPSVPKNLLGLVVGNTLNLAWTPTFGGGVPTNVILDVSGAVNGSAPLGPTDTFSFAGVPAGTYTLSVRAVNASGSSASSTPVTLTFPTACSGAPQPVANFLAYKTGGTLFLNWEPPATGTAPTSYVLNVTGSYVGSIPTALRALSGAVPAGTYNFSVVARNACGDSAPTAVQTVSVP